MRLKIQDKQFVPQTENGPYFLLCDDHSLYPSSDEVLKNLKPAPLDNSTAVWLNAKTYIQAYSADGYLIKN